MSRTGINLDEVLPTNNVMFQMIFGDERHPRILIHFLNSVIKPETPIKKVSIRRESATNQDHVLDKCPRLDIIADTDNEIINVEIQVTPQDHIVDRLLYYWSKLFAGQLIVGQKYHELKRTVSITVLSFDFFDEDDQYWRRAFLTNDHDGKRLTDKLEVHVIEIDKLRELKKDSPLTFWIEFFKNPYSEQVKSLCEFVPEIREAKEVFERAKSDPFAQEQMRIHEKAVMDYASGIATARDEGKAEGLAEGELKKARETARNLLSMGLSVEQIAKATGLSFESIADLQNCKS